jgi:hypothetical protein
MTFPPQVDKYKEHYDDQDNCSNDTANNCSGWAGACAVKTIKISSFLYHNYKTYLIVLITVGTSVMVVTVKVPPVVRTNTEVRPFARTTVVDVVKTPVVMNDVAISVEVKASPAAVARA